MRYGKRFFILLEVFRRQRTFFVFTLPEYCQNPPALPVVHQLNAVNPAGEWLCIGGRVLRIVCAENVGYLSELFRDARDFPFKKTFFFKEWRVARNVLLH